MTDKMLSIVSSAMEDLEINYGFVVYNTVPIVYPYFVGEYQEIDPINEDGMQEATFMLTGFTRSSWLSLEQAKTKIENYFGRNGRSFMQTDGSAVVISYGSAYIIPKEEADLKSIQINLNIKEWKVN